MGNLIIEDLNFTYGKKPIIRDLHLAVDEGEVVCLVGDSGCGKSTLLRLIAGLEQPKKGNIYINGTLCHGHKKNILPHKRNVGLVFQYPSLFPHLNIYDNVAFGMQNPSQDAIHRLLDQVELPHKRLDYPHMLSSGEQQRIALARALAPSPAIMLLDEAFANLDVLLRTHVREQTLFLLKSLNIATLLVTHDPDEALRMADRIYVMEKGEIIQHGKPESLYRSPNSLFVARLFGELNRFHATIENGNYHTPLGTIATKKTASTKQVALYVRPENLSCAAKSTKNSTKAMVEDTRFLGHYSLIYVRLADSHQTFRIRTTNSKLPLKGDIVYVTMDPEKVFMFSN